MGLFVLSSAVVCLGVVVGAVVSVGFAVVADVAGAVVTGAVVMCAVVIGAVVIGAVVCFWAVWSGFGLFGSLEGFCVQPPKVNAVAITAVNVNNVNAVFFITGTSFYFNFIWLRSLFPLP